MLSQKLQQKQTQKLSPQQIHLMKLLQMPVMALEQRIKKEIEENPVLEDLSDISTLDDDEPDFLDENNTNEIVELNSEENEQTNKIDTENEFSLEEYMDDDEDEIPAYKMYTNNKSKDDERKEIPCAYDVSFVDFLFEQVNLRSLTDTQKLIAKNIIGNLDESGYLKRELLSIADDLSFKENINVSVEEIEKVLHEIQQIDPPGIASRNLKECLSIQLNRMEDTDDVMVAREIIDKCIDEFTKKHYDKIITKLKISEKQLKKAENVILKLNPKPGGFVSSAEINSNYIIPDFSVSIIDDEPIITLTSPNSPELRIKNSYQKMFDLYSKSNDKSKKEAADYIKQKIDTAKIFIDSIYQRQKTLYTTMSAIVKRQKTFFMTGDEMTLKPLILKDISEDINMDISTVSRVVNSKYVVTPYGTYLLKFFFSESMSTNKGEEISNREIKLILAECVENEDKSNPMTDDELMIALNNKGYNIARRTVAKYRRQLNIPVARLRKKI